MSQVQNIGNLTPQEIKKEILGLGYKAIWLEDQKGTLIMGPGAAHGKPEEHLNKLFKLLETSGVNPGLYKVCAVSNYKRKHLDQPAVFWYHKPGTAFVIDDTNPTQPPMSESGMQSMTALLELAQLRAENAYLMRDNTRLQAENERLAKEVAEMRQPAMAEGPKGFLSEETFQAIAPALPGILSEIRQFFKPSQTEKEKQLAEQLRQEQARSEKQRAEFLQYLNRPQAQPQAIPQAQADPADDTDNEADEQPEYTLEELQTMVQDGLLSEGEYNEILRSNGII